MFLVYSVVMLPSSYSIVSDVYETHYLNRMKMSAVAKADALKKLGADLADRATAVYNAEQDEDDAKSKRKSKRRLSSATEDDDDDDDLATE